MKTTRLLLLLLVCWCACGLPAQAQRLQTENIVLITFDGLRWQELFGGADPDLIGNKEYVGDTAALRTQFWAPTPDARRQALLPFFWSEIAQKGQLWGNRQLGNKVNVTNRFWFSYPGYNEILTGRSDGRINSNNKVPNPNITILEYLNQQPAFKGKVAAFGSWDVFPYIINEERSGVPVNAGFEAAQGQLSEREQFLNELQGQIPSPWGSVRLDAFTQHYALEYVRKHRPRVLYMAYGETDDFAHDGKYDAYLTSAHRTDAFIRQLWETLQGMEQYRGKTTLILTTDHGRGLAAEGKWQHHGTAYPQSDEIWMAFLGPDTPALGECKQSAQIYQNQVAQTLAAYLGIAFPSEGRTGEKVAAALK